MKAHLNILALSLALLLTNLTGTASATNDGGLRSVFARGAGERALALGGAYGGVSGDATAMFWNPAGLANVPRNSLDAAHTNLIGLGFQEQFGVVALPSWRFGTFALAMRRFGVDGIEGRDDRGTLYADDLKDAQSELSLGYARSLGEAWQIGAALKMQRQDLAGESGSGLGFDAGIILRPGVAFGGTSVWAQGLSLGLTLRNLVEPTIQLVNDDVRDPAAVRFGGALQRPVGGNIDLLFSLDLEKTKDMDQRLHVGTELVLMEVLALRAGANDGMFTAGMGAHWNGLAVNYAFEDNTLETVHRFGLGIAFGASTDERRQTAIDLRDAELNTLLTTAFADQEEQRTNTAVRAVRAALAAKDYATALERVHALEVIAPTNPKIRHLEGQALFGLGVDAESANDLTNAAVSFQACLRADATHPNAANRLARVTAESERRAKRAGDLRALYRQAMDAFGANDLEQARDLFAEALVLAPEDTEIRDLSRHVSEAIRVRDEANAAQAAAQLAAEQAAAAASVVKWAPADESDAGTGNSAPVTTPTPVARPRFDNLSDARQREVAALYEQGVSAAAIGRHADAVRYWELVAAVAPDYQQVTDLLKQEYHAQGMEAFAAGRLERAIEIWESALALAPNDARTQGYLARAHQHRARLRSISIGNS